MQTTLPKDLRRKLESVIVKARDLAESAARTELQRLAVGEKTAASYLSDEQRRLRNRLRAHGRQLGDRRKPDGEQAIDRLVTEVAYEHWHRMLFARFLAENNLLIYEDGVTPVSIRDCFELAEEETGDRSLGWQYAARYAANMLPQIFRVDSPVFQLELAPNDQKHLEQRLTSLDEETFTASDALGWVYQFWQSKKKDEVNASEVKIGADELPAVTQLFTEPYMVSFLLDNSLGAWWAARRLTSQDLETAASEEDLRSKSAIPGVPLEYLRFVRTEGGSWTPASGAFDTWPENMSDLKTLDPCCGSGHFLVAAFLMLVPMRMELEGLSSREAVDAVLSENIHGLELDQRCVELAAFALALTAWRYLDAGGYRVLPDLNVACSGLAISAKKDEWLALAGDDTNLRLALEDLYKHFKDAPVLGSLINPVTSLDKGSLFEIEWEEVEPLLAGALEEKKADDREEIGVVAKGLAQAAYLLTGPYTLVMTNVPFLGRGKQTEVLRAYCEKFYSDAKSDLSTSMLKRCLELCGNYGTIVLVTPQVWLFQNSYTRFRESILDLNTINLLGKLGSNAFQDMNWWAAVTLLSIISSRFPDQNHKIVGVDVGSTKDRDEKISLLRRINCDFSTQSAIRSRPNSVIAFSNSTVDTLLLDVARSTEGLSTGDGSLFLREFWELPAVFENWEFFHTTTQEQGLYGGMSKIVFWELGKGRLAASAAARIQGHSAWQKKGVLLSRMNKFIPSIYTGNLFDKMAVIMTTDNDEYLEPIWNYISSPIYHDDVRELSQNVAVATNTLAQVPFDIKYWTRIARENYPSGLPKPYSDHPTQWIFHGHPCGSVIWDESTKWTANGQLRSNETVLQVAVARLLAYSWPAELDTSMELADEQREWVNHCEELLSFADDDGIACIPAVRGEQPAFERVEALLQAAYGDQWSISIRGKLLESVGCKNKSLDFWLREKFFEQHCKLFQDRPFIWHIWDGLKDGFAALVNYHHLDRKNLERLIYTYLDDWIRTQKHDQSEGVDGAGVRLAAAQGLKRRLEQILEGEAPYDVFVRWKPLEEQPVGWDPNLNDGVRLNIRPFLRVEDVGKKGAGILRAKPNIKWNKDRGKDVPSAPWYSLGLEHGEGEGARINDHHLTLAEKKAASDGR